MKLTNTDFKAIEMNEGEYLRIKARLLESNGDIENSLVYYNLASILGDSEAIGSLGEYYLNNKNTSLALAYFNIGVSLDDVLSLYNLGTLYFEGKKVDKDPELGHFYYSKALDLLNDDEEKLKYPSLFFNVAEDISKNALSINDLFQAYDYYLIAADGYDLALHNGKNEYAKKLKEVTSIINSEKFKEVREIMEHDECCDGECDGDCHCGHCHEN